MKRFTELDCGLFMEICTQVKKHGRFESRNLLVSAKQRQEKFWELRAALRRCDQISVPIGYGQALAGCTDFMDEITLTTKGHKLIATLKRTF